MKILMFITVYLPSPIYGGPTTVAEQQVKELVKRGHDVTIVTSNIFSFDPPSSFDDTSNILDGVKVLYFKTNYLKPKFSLMHSKSFVKWYKNNVKSFDIVHIHFARELMAISAAKIAKNKRVPYFLQTHGMLNNRNGLRTLIDKLFTNRLLKAAKNVLVLQEIEKKQITIIENNAKTLVLPNGLELVDSSHYWEFKSSDTKTILFLARLHPRKKVLDFIEVANILTNKGIKVNYRIVGPDGGDLNRALQKVEEYGLKQSVKFVGAISRKQAFIEYANSDIYILPSDKEPFPMSVLEALSIGIPTIVTEGMHNKKLLESYDAVIFSEANPNSLAEAVISILGNKEKANKLSQNGKRLIGEELNINKVIDKLEEIYLGGVVNE